MRTARRAACAVAVLALVAGCGNRPLRDEGATPPEQAHATPAVPVQPTGAATANIRNFALRPAVLADHRVPGEVKEILRTCDRCGLEDPRYTDVTGDGADDVVVPVADLANGGTAATLVYAVLDRRLTLVYGAIGRGAAVRPEAGDLVVTRQLYRPGDPHCCPSGGDETRYHWDGTRFAVAAHRGGGPGLAPYGGAEIREIR